METRDWKYKVTFERTATAKGTIGYKVTGCDDESFEVAMDAATKLKMLAQNEAGEIVG